MTSKQSVFEQIHRRLQEGPVEFSANVQVSLRLRDALAAPDCHTDKAVKLLQQEPVLAARVIALANSVAYNPYGREIGDLRAAVSRLGFASLRSLSMGWVTRQLAAANLAPGLQQVVDQLWRHSTQVAALSRVIARKVTGVDAEEAFFAGLIHELGGFYLLSCANEIPDLIDGEFGEWVESGERLVGEPLMRGLNVPEHVQQAVLAYWDGYLEMPPVSLGDTLLLADELAPLPSPLRPLPLAVNRRELDAQIEMTIGENLLSEILADSEQELVSLANALNF